MSKCLTNNPWKVHQKINYSENNEIFVGGVFLATPCREFTVALPWELLYADDLVVTAETENDLIKRLNNWNDNVENRGMRVNMNKTKVTISGERQKLMQKAAWWPRGVCGRGVGSNSIQLSEVGTQEV